MGAAKMKPARPPQPLPGQEGSQRAQHRTPNASQHQRRLRLQAAREVKQTSALPRGTAETAFFSKGDLKLWGFPPFL